MIFCSFLKNILGVGEIFGRTGDKTISVFLANNESFFQEVCVGNLKLKILIEETEFNLRFLEKRSSNLSFIPLGYCRI